MSLSVRILIAVGLFAASAAAQAQAHAHCRVSSLIKKSTDGRVFPEIIYGKKITYPLQTTVIEVPKPRLSGGGTRKVEVAHGETHLVENIKMLDANANVVEKPLQIDVTITPPLRHTDGVFRIDVKFKVQYHNVFTDKTETVAFAHTQLAENKLMYVEHGTNLPNPTASPLGTMVGTILFCEFSPHDSMGGNIPFSRTIDDFVRP